MIILGVIASNILKKISDTFTRTTTGTLSTSDSGSEWVVGTSGWYANGSAAVNNQASSSYPVAYINVSQNANISASVGPGAGLAFWVSAANSWWASAYTQQTSTYQCNPYSCGCFGYSCNPYPCNPYQCNPYQALLTYYTVTTTYSCNPYTCFVCEVPRRGGGCAYGYWDTCYQTCSNTEFVPVYQTLYETCYQTCSQTCVACSTCYQTCSTTSHYLQLVKSYGGSVSAVTSNISLSSQAAAIAVKTVNNNIEIKAYSDTAMTSQIGSTYTYTADNPIFGQGVGIIKVPTSNENAYIDNFVAEG